MLVLYSGIFRVFDPSFRAFLQNVVIPNPSHNFEIVVHSENGHFCSDKDISCQPAQLALGQCNMCSCIYKPDDVDAAIRVSVAHGLKEQGVPVHRVSIRTVVLESVPLPLSRLKAAWAAAKESLEVFHFKHVLYIRPDGAPTTPVVLEDWCQHDAYGASASTGEPAVYIMSGEVDRGRDWPLHSRDYDLGALACHPYGFDVFAESLNTPCADVWDGCAGVGADAGAGKPPVAPGSLGGKVLCDSVVCGMAATFSKKQLLLGSMDDKAIYSRLYRVKDTCEVTHQQDPQVK